MNRSETGPELDDEDVLGRIRGELEAACGDACLDASTFAVYVVAGRRPPGTTPMAYLHPEGFVQPDTVLVFREAGAARAERHRGTRHRVAVWEELPGFPPAAFGPMLRHEVEHARRWERSGTPFFEADDLLRGAVRAAGGLGYQALASEREANAASAAYARRGLSPAELAEVAGMPECEALVTGADVPDDVVAATLADLVARRDWRPGLAGSARATFVEDLRRACAAWEPVAARASLEQLGGPIVELV